MPKHIKNSKLALIGLIILFAVSSLMAGGGKPKIEKASANLRPLSASEIMGILQSFPEMVPGFLKEDVFSKKDTLRLKRLFRFSELDNTLLKQIFSNARFYRGFDGKKPPHPYLMVVVENKRYSMPSNFNRLLLEHNLEVNDGNIIELAKAFVIIALEGKEITFLEGKRIKEGYRPLHIEWDVEIKCRINGEVQTWKFSQSRNYSKGKWIKIGQFAVAMSFVNNKAARYYQINRFEKEEGGRGEIDNPPGIKIDPSVGDVTVEQDSFYYLITYRNGGSTKDSVRFLLYDFEPNQEDVYIRIVPQPPYTYGPDATLGLVDIDGNGDCSFDWMPGSVTTYKIYFYYQFFVFTNNQVFSKIA